ncbi:alpha/beta hydrolase [Promineifilum sp.]|uniref:alpha/beta hydrolase n=1 Tax=Promineifilum sp. TaxID=2664178 RepID=UPI0035B0DBB6
MIRHEAFPSRLVMPRHVDVWLPPDYNAEPARRYPVLYLHDGQNCFDPKDCAFGVAWEVQHALLRLVMAGEARPAILVGVWNVEPLRLMDYRPARPFHYLSERARTLVTAGMGGMPQSDAYLAYLVRELKPFIDLTYRTRPGRDDTFIMGSSMGGLISLYALCEYPEVFGSAACVSTHWPAVEGVIAPYLRDTLPPPGTHRLYFDHGTETLDALYAPIQAEVDGAMAAAGYTRGRDWLTLPFPGARHFEKDWQERVHIPLRFLLAA